MKKITIFTPTYNRAYCLKNLYESLLQQNTNEFVWLIVDDGSTDDTNTLIDEFIDQQIIEIKYFYQENAGKMAAHNKGVDLCDTELFMCLDSDDTLLPDAISILCDFWESVKETEGLAGIVALKKLVNEFGEDISAPFPEVRFSTLYDLYNGGFKGETALAFKTAVLKRYPFKIFQGEKYIPENTIYRKIDKFHELAVLNTPIMLCMYRTDGYTSNLIKHQVNSPKSMSYAFLTDLFFLDLTFIKMIRTIVNYIAYSLIAGYKLSKILKDAPHKIFIFIFYPLGFIQKYRILNR